MNINAAVSNQIKLPALTHAKAEQDVKAIEPKPQRMLTAEEQFAKDFYTKEHEPWKDKSLEYSDDQNGGTSAKPSQAQKQWVENQHLTAASQLEIHGEIFNRTMKELHFTDSVDWIKQIAENTEPRKLRW